MVFASLLGLLLLCQQLVRAAVTDVHPPPLYRDGWTMRIEGGDKAVATLQTARRNLGSVLLQKVLLGTTAMPWLTDQLKKLGNRCCESTWTFDTVKQSQEWLLQRAHTLEGLIICNIIRDRGIVLIRMPKTAGTTIAKTLTAYSSIIEVGGAVLDRVGVNSLASYQVLIVSPMVYHKSSAFREKFKDRLHLAVVRDPYTRTLSAWRWCASTKRRSLRDSLMRPPQRAVEGWDIDWSESSQIMGMHDWIHFSWTQAEALSLQGKMYVDCVFHLAELNTLVDWLNVVIRPHPRVPAISFDNVQPPLTQEQVQHLTADGLVGWREITAQINRMFQQDFRLLGFEERQTYFGKISAFDTFSWDTDRNNQKGRAALVEDIVRSRKVAPHRRAKGGSHE
jgi:hypothetical protein